MTKRPPATKQPTARQPNSLPLGSKNTARASKASEFRLRFRPFYNQKLSEVPKLYLWELAGYDKHSANGNLLRASEMATEYLKELGLIKPKSKPKKIRYCQCCFKNPRKASKKFCGKCERDKKAAAELENVRQQAIARMKEATDVLSEFISDIESPEWHSCQWRIK